MKQKKYNAKNKRGSVLVVSLILFGIIIVTALSVAISALRERKTSMQSSKTNIAYQNADEGIDKVMTALLKGKKNYNVSGKIEISSILSATGLSCGGTPEKLSKGSEYAVELFDSSIPPVHINCSSQNDISTIAQLKSTGNDNALGTQRIVEANVPQKDLNIKFLLHADTASGGNNFVDSSRVHHTITPNGASILTSNNTAPIVPNFGYAIFDGSNDYLNSTDSPIGNWDNISEGGTSPFTVDFWVNLNGDGDNASKTFFQLQDGSEIIVLKYNPGTKAITLQRNGSIVVTCTHTVNVSDTDYKANGWFHVALVEASGTTPDIKLYLGGNNKNWAASCKDDGKMNVENIYIGRNGSSGTEYFKGYMDEFRFYSAAFWTGEFKNDCPVDDDNNEDCKPY